MHGAVFQTILKNTSHWDRTMKFHTSIAIINIYGKKLLFTRNRSWVRCQDVKYFQILKNRSSLNMIPRSFKLSTQIDTYILYFEKNQQLPMYHGFDSRASRKFDFSRLKYIGHISESFLWHFPTAQRFKISHSHKRDQSHIRTSLILS